MKTPKRINRKFTIKYHWENTEGIKPEHIEALEESALALIHTMMGEGFTSGELNDDIRMTDSDPEDGIHYTGWWEKI